MSSTLQDRYIQSLRKQHQPHRHVCPLCPSFTCSRDEQLWTHVRDAHSERLPLAEGEQVIFREKVLLLA